MRNNLNRKELAYFIEHVNSKKWNKVGELFVSHDNEIVVTNKIIGPDSGIVLYKGSERRLTFIQNLITIYNIIFNKTIIFDNPILGSRMYFIKNAAANFN